MRRQGYRPEATAAELRAWFDAPAVYGTPETLDEILEHDLLVVHELVEITEAKLLEVHITHDVFTRCHDQVEEAHRRALAVELQVALAIENRDHVESRLREIQGYQDDPRLPVEWKRKYREFIDGMVSK